MNRLSCLQSSVVQALKDTLCREGVPVLLYNSRGVGKSSGRASWTGEPERKDYQAVTDWLVNFKAKDILDFSGETKRTLEVFCCVSEISFFGWRLSTHAHFVFIFRVIHTGH
jgi:hypothetical protein